jgi:hypothetical protein
MREVGGVHEAICKVSAVQEDEILQQGMPEECVGIPPTLVCSCDAVERVRSRWHGPTAGKRETPRMKSYPARAGLGAISPARHDFLNYNVDHIHCTSQLVGKKSNCTKHHRNSRSDPIQSAYRQALTIIFFDTFAAAFLFYQ